MSTVFFWIYEDLGSKESVVRGQWSVVKRQRTDDRRQKAALEKESGGKNIKTLLPFWLLAFRVGPVTVPVICYRSDYFSYYTVVIPDESDCGGRDPVSTGLPLFPWIPDIHLRRIQEWRDYLSIPQQKIPSPPSGGRGLGWGGVTKKRAGINPAPTS